AVRVSAPSFVRFDFDSNVETRIEWATGGGIYSDRSQFAVDACRFRGNTATAVQLPGDGGAIFSDQSVIVVTESTFEGNASGAGAGAFYSFAADRSSLIGCTFRDNTSAAGGAMYVEGSYPFVKDCDFVSNTAANGGAVFLGEFSSPTFQDCRFDSNTAVPNSGGAVDCWHSTGTFLRCDFVGNDAALRGGAFSVNVVSGPSFTDCVFARNAAPTGGAVRLAGSGTAVLVGCAMIENTATVQGAGIYGDGVSAAILDRTLIAFGNGAAVVCAGSAWADITCTDVFGNTGGDWTGCIAAELGADGNFSADPELCDMAGGDYRVSLPTSPCLPANNPCGQLVGSLAGGCGCPTGTTMKVPGDHATIAAALAAALPGDVIGVCSGTYAETLELLEGVHILGVRSDLVTVIPGVSADAVVVARHVADSTVVEAMTLDGAGLVPQVVLAESTSTGLHLRGNRITGGSVTGVRNGPDSRLRLGGALASANDLFGNGGSLPLHLVNENTTADSLDATLNWWGTTSYDSVLAAIQGPVRSCPITNAAHSDSLCAPLSALAATSGAGTPAVLSLGFAPNPFASAGAAAFTLPAGSPVALTVYDVLGRRVRTLVKAALPAGTHRVAWSGRDEAGRPVAPGVYFLRLEALGETRTGKVVRLR
ncbi:MAG: right-handed parallel beta-helix repeat-containing protein, partial [Candidatus Eiseniibacteriota bacterium]